MAVFIYLIAQDIIIHCFEQLPCIQISHDHFTSLLSMGALELSMEIPMTIRIFRYKARFLKEQIEKNKEQNKS